MRPTIVDWNREKGQSMARVLLGLRSLVCLVAVLAVAGSVAGAAPPAPNFLPGQPMLAGNQVIAMWLPVPGAVKYIVYLNGAKVAELSANQYIAPAPEKAGEYVYEVSAVGATGAEGPKSKPGKITIIKLEPPTDLLARTDRRSKLISLRWSAGTGAVLFNVFRAPSKEGPFELIASVQAPGHKDPNLEPGTYYYRVTARDVSGKESAPSDVLEVVLEPPPQVVKKIKIVFQIWPSKETARYEWLGEETIGMVADLKLAPDGRELWLADPGRKAIYVLSVSDGALAAKIGPLEFRPVKLDFDDRGTLYVTGMEGTVNVMSADGTVQETWQMPRPPETNEAIWKRLPAAVKSYGSQGGDVLCRPDEVWVSDQKFQVIERFTYDGEFLGYLYEYTDITGKKVRFPAVGEMEELPGGRVLVTFPLGHYAVALESDGQGGLKEVYNIGVATAGFVGGFIGIAGVGFTPDGNLVLTDPGVHTVQVFSVESGRYLYHIGGDEPKEDPRQPGRPLIDFSGLSFAQFTRKGELVLYAGTEKAIMKRRLVGDGPVAPEKP